MDERTLQELLGAADRAAGPGAAGANGLAARVRQAARARQRRARAARMGAAALVLAGLAAFVIARAAPRRGPAVASAERGAPASAAVTSQETAAADPLRWLEAEADARTALVIRLRAEEARQRLRAERSRSLRDAEPGRGPGDALERAALILVVQGDHFSNQPGLRGTAARLYAEAVASFPETRWAAEAHARLERMGEGERG